MTFFTWSLANLSEKYHLCLNVELKDAETFLFYTHAFIF